MKKGITPIISIIVLLLITVALAGVAWTYLSGFLTTYTKGSFVITTGGVYCSAGTIHIIVNNPGAVTITKEEFIIDTVTGTGAVGLDTTDVPANGHADFKENCGDAAGACVGSYTIDLGTTATVQHLSVAC